MACGWVGRRRCADGHSYERAAIEGWLAGHTTSPLTNEELANTTLKPNITLRILIQALNADDD